jgi:hypothetical protein
MIQSVFDHGRLMAFHANLRVRAGSNNGAAIKRSIQVPVARDAITRLSDSLGWHGALSADAILIETGPLLIDINPRLVEPTNALHAGVDLVGACVSLALDANLVPQPVGGEDVTTPQTLLASWAPRNAAKVAAASCASSSRPPRAAVLTGTAERS